MQNAEGLVRDPIIRSGETDIAIIPISGYTVVESEVRFFMYITVKQAAATWGISDRRVRKLCEEGRISAD